MADFAAEPRVELTPGPSLWQRCFTVAPLVVIGTVEPDGRPDLAPKHLAMPVSWERHFGFVCAPTHATFRNAIRENFFTVSYVGADQAVLASLAATPREDDDQKPVIAALPLEPAHEGPGVLLAGAYLHLECELVRVVENLDQNGLLIGRVLRASARAGAVRDPDRDDAELLAAHPPLAYLHPGRLASVAETQAFPLPEGFRR